MVGKQKYTWNIIRYGEKFNNDLRIVVMFNKQLLTLVHSEELIKTVYSTNCIKSQLLAYIGKPMLFQQWLKVVADYHTNSDCSYIVAKWFCGMDVTSGSC